MTMLSIMDNEYGVLIILLSIYLVLGIGFFVRDWYFLRKEKMRTIKTEGLVNGKTVIEEMLKEAGKEGVEIMPKDAVIQCYYYSPRRNRIVLSAHACYCGGYYEVMRAATTASNVIQRDEAVGLIDMYLRLAPFMEWMSRVFPIVILAGLYCISFAPMTIGMILLSMWLLLIILSLLMRPVRVDASRRSCEWLISHGYVNEQDRGQLEKVGRYIANYNLLLVVSSIFAIFFTRARLRWPSDKSV